MTARDATFRTFSIVLAACLVAASSPGLTASPTASLNGVVRSADDRGPLVGARVLAADTASGAVVRSEPTGGDGSYRLTGLTPADYELAVEASGGLYLVGDSLRLERAAARRVDLQVRADADKSDPGTPIKGGSISSVWNNPFSAALIVLGSAVVVGVLVDNATDDDDEPVSPF